MTETDATRRPLTMPEKFLPYLEKHRIYKIFKDMVKDLIINLPKDHLKHMKVFLSRRDHLSKDADCVIILVSPELNIDVKKLVKIMIKDMGCFVITRRGVMDRFEKHDNYEPGCVSPILMSEVTKSLTLKDPVAQAGWLMYDHPCTVREARCLQQDGVLPTVTLVLMPPPPTAPQTDNPLTPARSFFDQDFEGLKYLYKATVKEIFIEPDDDDHEKLATKCFNAVKACAAGAQGPGQGHHVVGAPGSYRVLLIGPTGSGRRTQAQLLSKHFGLVYLHFDDIFEEARLKNDSIGHKIREYGTSLQIKAAIVQRRILEKDCLDHGWVLTGYPLTAPDFENLDKMSTPPNRIVFLNTDWATCKKRAMATGVDWCTGQQAPVGSGPRVLPYPKNTDANLENELDLYFSESLAELRASAGITAVEVNANDNIENVQVRLQAAVMAAPAFTIECCAQLRNVRAD